MTNQPEWAEEPSSYEDLQEQVRKHSLAIQEMQSLVERHGETVELFSEVVTEKLLETRRILDNGVPPLPDFLDWIADRFVNHYNESPNVDFVQALRRHANKLRNLRQQLGR